MANTDLSREEITTKVIALIKEVAETEIEITDKTSLLDELEIDSLTMVRLDIAIQSAIGLALSADDLEEIVTVNDLVTTLIEKGQPVESID